MIHASNLSVSINKVLPSEDSLRNRLSISASIVPLPILLVSDLLFHS